MKILTYDEWMWAGAALLVGQCLIFPDSILALCIAYAAAMGCWIYVLVQISCSGEEDHIERTYTAASIK